MPFRVTEPCNRFLEASHDPAEVIRQMRAGPLSDVVGQAVKDLLLLVETDCVAGVRGLELANVVSKGDRWNIGEPLGFPEHFGSRDFSRLRTI